MNQKPKSLRRDRRDRRIASWSKLTERDWREIRALARREERSIAAQVALIVRRYLRGELVERWKVPAAVGGGKS